MTVEITYRFTRQPGTIRAVPDDPDDAVRRLNAGNSVLLRVGQAGRPTARTLRDGLSNSILGCSVSTRMGAGSRRRSPLPRCLVVPTRVCRSNWCSTRGRTSCSLCASPATVWGPDVLGSFHYAISHLRKSLRLLVVLGHSGCGALTAAVDAFLDPGGYLEIATNEQLRSIVDRHLIAVQASARALARAYGSDVIARPGYREALIEAAITTNAALAAHTLQAELHGRGHQGLKAVYGVFLLETHMVWTPEAGSGGLGDSSRGSRRVPAISRIPCQGLSGSRRCWRAG